MEEKTGHGARLFLEYYGMRVPELIVTARFSAGRFAIGTPLAKTLRFYIAVQVTRHFSTNSN
jgi:hypothetical protein